MLILAGLVAGAVKLRLALTLPVAAVTWSLVARVMVGANPLASGVLGSLNALFGWVIGAGAVRVAAKAKVWRNES